MASVIKMRNQSIRSMAGIHAASAIIARALIVQEAYATMKREVKRETCRLAQSPLSIPWLGEA